jgi:HEAT repeat protein
MSKDISTLRTDLVGQDVCRQLAAAREFSEMGEEACAAAVELAKAAAAENDDVREWSVAALEELGPPEPSALDALVELLNDSHADVAYWAATLLGRLEAEAGPAVDALSAALSADRPSTVRQRAAWALGSIGPAAAAATTALKQAAGDSDPRLARLAQTALEQIGE